MSTDNNDDSKTSIDVDQNTKKIFNFFNTIKSGLNCVKNDFMPYESVPNGLNESLNLLQEDISR